MGWEGMDAILWMGVVCPCPLVHNGIATLRRLLFAYGDSFECQSFLLSYCLSVILSVCLSFYHSFYSEPSYCCFSQYLFVRSCAVYYYVNT